MYNRRAILKSFEENKSFIDAKLSETIQKHRKGTGTLQLTDDSGQPIEGACVEIKQTGHVFKYGANIFMLDEFESEEKNKLYRERFKEICNIATLPFYWRDLEPEQGNPRYAKDSPKIYRRPAIDLCLSYCEENGIEPKEHCLMYETWLPDWLDKQNLQEMKRELEKRIQDLAMHYADKILDWEVTNETLYAWKNCSALYNEPDFVEWCFACAEKYLQYNSLIINDAHCNIWNVFNGNRSQYYMQIERALQKGARIDSIGMQYHMFYTKEEEEKETALFYDPLHVYRVLDCYSAFKKPIQITELTIPAYSYTKEDEAIQAEIMRWLYTIWFSHPAIEAIIYWNLVDGYAAFAPQGDMTAGENYYHGGLMRFDMTPKPAFHTIQNLFDKEWHTEEKMITNDKGVIDFSGFYGDYEITVHYNEKSKQYKLKLTADNEKSFQFIF